MTSAKIGRNEPCPCGSGKKYKNCCLSKREVAIESSRGASDAIQGRVNDAIAQFQSGRLQEAALLCQRILDVNPNQADALNILGLVCLQMGKNEQALSWIDKALVVVQTDSLYMNRGGVLMTMGRLKEASQSFSKALELNDRSAIAYANLGTTLQAMGEQDAAITSFNKSLSIDPKFAPAHSGLGAALLSQGDLEQALKYLQEALILNPSIVDAHSNIGTILWKQRRLADALSVYRNALSLNPHHIPTLENVGLTLGMMNRMEESLETYRVAYTVAPTLEHKIQSTLAIPHIHQSKAEMLENRREFEQRLDELMTGDEMTPIVTELLYCRAAFNLAFQGLDDKRIQQKLAKFYEKVCPQLLYRAPHVDTSAGSGRRVRLGFLSKYIYNHPVAHSFSRLIEALAEQSGFEVFLISAQKFDADSVKKVYPSFSGKQVQISSDYVKSRQAIADLKLDILVYQDIGMDEISYFLAFARLARYQCVMGGHPDTTGIGNIDYFISSALAETSDADAHYSEKMVRLPTGAFFFEPPAVPSPLKGREAFGLPASGSLYVCPMMLQKIHPDFDEAIDKLLQADPGGYVIFFKHPDAGWEGDLMRRFDRTIAAPQRERVLFLPWIRDYADFVNMNALADVVLDPFHFGIGTTAIATFAVGTPIVTLPGEFMRSRVGLFYSRLLDMTEFVASDLDDYIAKAVRMATDRPWRDLLSSKIKANRHVFYENKQAIEDLTNFFVGLTSSESVVI